MAVEGNKKGSEEEQSKPHNEGTKQSRNARFCSCIIVHSCSESPPVVG